MLCVPLASAELVMLQLPPVATALPIYVVPSNSVTVLPASAVPVKVGVVTLVMPSVLDDPVSDAAVRAGVEGATGAELSIVSEVAVEATPTLPAASVAFAVMLCVPLPSAELVMLQLPPVATALPINVVPSNSVTVLPASAVPVKVGVVTLVMPSMLDDPVSEAALRAGVDGATGAEVSIVTDVTAEATPTLPAASVAFAVMLCAPLPSAELVMLQLPPVATALPICVVPSNKVTVLPASAVPVKVGVVTLVMPSVLDEPVSEATIRFGVDGATGAPVSIVTGVAAEAAPTLPAVSVAFAVMLCVPLPSVELVMLQLPPVATALPICVVPSNKATVLPASAVPVKVGVVTLVIPSVLDEPVSEAALRVGVDGATGAPVSIVTDVAVEATPTLPAASVAFAVMLCAPLPSAELVMLQLPPVATALPICVVPSNKRNRAARLRRPGEGRRRHASNAVRAGRARIRSRTQGRRGRRNRCERVDRN